VEHGGNNCNHGKDSGQAGNEPSGRSTNAKRGRDVAEGADLRSSGGRQKQGHYGRFHIQEAATVDGAAIANTGCTGWPADSPSKLLPFFLAAGQCCESSPANCLGRDALLLSYEAFR